MCWCSHQGKHSDQCRQGRFLFELQLGRTPPKYTRLSRWLPVARAATLAQARCEDGWQGDSRNSGCRYLHDVGHKFSCRASRGQQIAKG
jgi:hypothetical protein